MTNLPNFAEEHNNKLEQLFGNLPTETDISVTLPSLGKFYTSKSRDVIISPIKFEDEKQLSVAIKNRQNPINIILSKCVKGVDINNLLILDKLYLLLKIREISYGHKYPAEVTCSHCGHKSEIEVDLSKIMVNYMPEDFEDPREITLPTLNKKVVLRFPRISDEKSIETIKSTYDNLYRFILKFDGNDNPVFINKALNHQKMPISDIKIILREITRDDLGLVPKFMLQCENCGEESVLEVPITEDFFSVT